MSASSFDKATLNRAVSRFAQNHAWARQPGQQAAVRKAAAYLLSKEHSLYSAPAKKRKKTMGGPDTPPEVRGG